MGSSLESGSVDSGGVESSTVSPNLCPSSYGGGGGSDVTFSGSSAG